MIVDPSSELPHAPGPRSPTRTGVAGPGFRIGCQVQVPVHYRPGPCSCHRCTKRLGITSCSPVVPLCFPRAGPGTGSRSYHRRSACPAKGISGTTSQQPSMLPCCMLFVARCMLPEAAPTAIPHVRERVKHGWPHRGRQCPGCAAVCRPLAGRNIVVSRTGQVGRCSNSNRWAQPIVLVAVFTSHLPASCSHLASSCLSLDMLAILLPCLAIILPSPELEQLVWDRGAPFSCFLSTGHPASLAPWELRWHNFAVVMTVRFWPHC